MAFEEGKRPFTCPDCGARHEAHYYRLPISERQTLKCLSCGGVLCSGKGPIEYERLKLI